MKNLKNVTLIVSTCEKNKYLLDNFFKLLKIHFDFDGPIKVTINSNYKYPDFEISVINKKLKDTSFSTSLIYALKEVKTDFIIFMLEDFYLLNKVDNKIVESAINILENDKNVNFIQLNDQSFIKQFLYSKKVYNEYFLLKNDVCPYSCNAQFGIWRKSFLLKVLRYKESAWQFEYYGSLRVNKFKHKSLTIKDEYKMGSKLYPDGGVLSKGKVISNFSKLFKNFSLNPLSINQVSGSIRKPKIYNRFKRKLTSRFYHILSIHFPFVSKLIIDQEYISKDFSHFDVEYCESKEYKQKHPTIGILYIATGKYICFWKKFYKSFEKNFLTKFEKIYYLFTDSNLDNLPDNVKLIYQKNLGWPYNTLFRYKIFLEHKELLNLCQYLYFVNANIICKREVGSEILPSDIQKYTVTLHPAFYKLSSQNNDYETNKNSTAFVSNKGKYYFCGGFNGGITIDFLAMCQQINDNINKDLKNKIIAKWHDESHLNKYMLNKNPLILSPQYAYPEGMPFNKSNLVKYKHNFKLLILDKRKWGGHNYLRGL